MLLDMTFCPSHLSHNVLVIRRVSGRTPRRPLKFMVRVDGKRPAAGEEASQGAVSPCGLVGSLGRGIR